MLIVASPIPQSHSRSLSVASRPSLNDCVASFRCLINHLEQPLPKSLEKMIVGGAVWKYLRLLLSPLRVARTLSRRVPHLVWKVLMVDPLGLSSWNWFTYRDKSILPNPYHRPPAPTKPESLTLVGSAFSAFWTRVTNGPGIVKSA
jgi:hypothetical protein